MYAVFPRSEDQPAATPPGNRWIFSAGLAAFALVMIMAGGVWDPMQTFKMAFLIAGGACVATGPIALLVRAPSTPKVPTEKAALFCFTALDATSIAQSREDEPPLVPSGRNGIHDHARKLVPHPLS